MRHLLHELERNLTRDSKDLAASGSYTIWGTGAVAADAALNEAEATFRRQHLTTLSQVRERCSNA